MLFLVNVDSQSRGSDTRFASDIVSLLHNKEPTSVERVDAKAHIQQWTVFAASCIIPALDSLSVISERQPLVDTGLQ